MIHFRNIRLAWLLVPAFIGSLTSCDLMKEDMSDCPTGLYVSFRYDYNLQRADMFNDHVGSVTLYIFSEDGKLVKTQEESNVGEDTPLRNPAYAMHVTDLEPGKYRLLALAGQKPYADMLATRRAKFVRADMPVRCDMQSLDIQLERQPREDGRHEVVHNGLPLDTLWHGLLTEPVEVYPYLSYKETYATVPLVRDTKHIHVALRELDDPTLMDIARYDLKIYDHNAHILWDNSLDETDEVVYTPYATWNSDDRTPATGTDGSVLEGTGKIGHADFMTSRLLYHDDVRDDGVLEITNRQTGATVAALNLPDLLSRLRTSDELHAYSPQEFLDRGYDYQVTLFLRGARLDYITIEISVLGWSKRVQFEELQ